jgi:hypothetical protein
MTVAAHWAGGGSVVVNRTVAVHVNVIAPVPVVMAVVAWPIHGTASHSNWLLLYSYTTVY